jgi:hypothetical protein
MLMPDETKTSRVAEELADGETVVLVAVDVEGGSGFNFRVTAMTDMDMQEGTEAGLVARCVLPWQARAVAFAVSGACDCDLDLGPVDDDRMDGALPGQELNSDVG